MKRQLSILSCIFLMAILPSCVPSTPRSRIEQRPQDFEILSREHKKLVLDGEIAKGMSKEAVIIAWGKPAARVQGLRNGKVIERWDYRGQQPVVVNPFFGGYNYGSYGSYQYSGLHGGLGTQVEYIPYRRASVWFLDDKVNEWERTFPLVH